MCDNNYYSYLYCINVVPVLTPGGPGCHGRVASIEGWGQETYVSCVHVHYAVHVYV